MYVLCWLCVLSVGIVFSRKSYFISHQRNQQQMECSVPSEDSKCDVVYQLLCMGCLCGGRATKPLTQPALMKYYQDILSDIQVSSVGIPSPTPRLCWECAALLKRAFHFTQQVRECFVILQPTLLMLGSGSEDLSACLSSGVCRVPRLQSCQVSTINIATDGLASSGLEGPGNAVKTEYIEVPVIVKEEPEDFDNKDQPATVVDAEYPDGSGEQSATNEESVNRQTYIYPDTATTSKVSVEYVPDNVDIETCEFNDHTASQRKILHKCPTCLKEFMAKSYLKVHMRIHTGEKPYRCAVCQKEFNQGSELKVHMRTHTGEKPFTCPVCQKSFAYNLGLKEHLTSHAGAKPYKCRICEKSYADNGELKVHMRTHTEEKEHTCSVCQKVFKSNSYLQVHMVSHTGDKPFKCPVCQKGCTHASELRVHMRTHTGEKPFKCTVCQKAFTNSGHLKDHMRTHTGERPFKCTICDKAFTTSSYLKVHIRTHTVQ